MAGCDGEFCNGRGDPTGCTSHSCNSGEMRHDIVDAAARLALFIHHKANHGGEEQHKDLILILKELKNVTEECVRLRRERNKARNA